VIAIIDYQMGNVGSIRNMFRKVGATSVVTSDPEAIAAASKIVLPGVGAFDTGMTRIRQMGLEAVLNEKVLLGKTPILGICLGMQLLTERSEEGDLPGLGWIEGETIRFRIEQKRHGLKVPHMGWNSIAARRRDSLFRDLEDDAGFYFVHSYHVVCRNDADVLATAHHEYDFVCAVERGNIMGTQFHPEKSHRYGMRVLKNFAETA